MSKKIDPSVIQRATNAIQGKSKATRGVKSARVALERKAKQEKDRLIDLQWKIFSGETTGDRALDIAIMLFQKTTTGSKEYRQIRRLLRLFEEHRGELFYCTVGPYGLGVLPVEGELLQSVTRWDSFPDTITRKQVNEPTGLQIAEGIRVCSVDEFIFTGDSLNRLIRFEDLESAFLFGEAIQSYLEEKTGQHAINLWRKSKELGQPLKETVAIAHELARQREELMSDLMPLVIKLGDCKKRINRIRGARAYNLIESPELLDPISVQPTDRGLLLKYAVFDEAERLAERIRERLATKSWLSLEGSPFYNEVERVLSVYDGSEFEEDDDDIPF